MQMSLFIVAISGRGALVSLDDGQPGFHARRRCHPLLVGVGNDADGFADAATRENGSASVAGYVLLHGRKIHRYGHAHGALEQGAQGHDYTHRQAP